ncbi:MAG: helix-hairpin-helix domain-containing protein [Eggerthellaceae bacterium]
MSRTAAVGVCVVALCAALGVVGSGFASSGVRVATGDDGVRLSSEAAEALDQGSAQDGAQSFAQAAQLEGASSEGSQEHAASIFVHVIGAVREPGVYELSQGSRVSDAVEAAGGTTSKASVDSVNLARVLTDGEQVLVPTKAQVKEQGKAAGQDDSVASQEGGATAGSAASARSAGGSDSQSAETGKVNINTASSAELQTLKGVGPATAQKIIDERTENGPFAKVDDLTRVSGIGEKKLAAIRYSITVG